MATPRKRYFRVADSILREPWTRDEKLTLILLSAWLNQRWARDGLTPDQACQATLTRAALCEITGRSQLTHARRALSALEARVTISVSVLGELTEIHWPKWSEFQGLPSDSRAEPRTENAPSASASRGPRPRPRPASPPQRSKTSSEGVNARRKNGASAPRKQTRHMTPALMARLVKLTPDDVVASEDAIGAWYESMKPRWEDRGFVDFHRAARNWWPRARQYEVDRAAQEHEVITMPKSGKKYRYQDVVECDDDRNHWEKLKQEAKRQQEIMDNYGGRWPTQEEVRTWKGPSTRSTSPTP